MHHHNHEPVIEDARPRACPNCPAIPPGVPGPPGIPFDSLHCVIDAVAGVVTVDPADVELEPGDSIHWWAESSLEWTVTFANSPNSQTVFNNDNPICQIVELAETTYEYTVQIQGVEGTGSGSITVSENINLFLAAANE